MEVLERSKNKTYGTVFSKSINGKSVTEEYQYDRLTIRLPLGELLFTVAEAKETLQKMLLEKSSGDILIDEYFSNKEYNLTEFINGFSLDEAELKHISEVIRYLDNIADNKLEFSGLTLKNLFFTVFPRGHSFYYLLSSTDRYRLRRICSKLSLPFGNTTDGIFRQLSETYAAFSFFTVTELKTLTELCALSLFEILESGQIIRRCENCNRFFVAGASTQFCNRPDLVNNHMGCDKQKSSLYNQTYRKKDSVYSYKRIYNRLQARTTRHSVSINDLKTFEDFKKEWALLKIKHKNSQDYEKRIMDFLQSERWK